MTEDMMSVQCGPKVLLTRDENNSGRCDKTLPSSTPPTMRGDKVAGSTEKLPIHKI